MPDRTRPRGRAPARGGAAGIVSEVPWASPTRSGDVIENAASGPFRTFTNVRIGVRYARAPSLGRPAPDDHHREDRQPCDQHATQHAVRVTELVDRIADVGRIPVTRDDIGIDAGPGERTEEAEIEREVTVPVRDV